MARVAHQGSASMRTQVGRPKACLRHRRWPVDGGATFPRNLLETAPKVQACSVLSSPSSWCWFPTSFVQPSTWQLVLQEPHANTCWMEPHPESLSWLSTITPPGACPHPARGRGFSGLLCGCVTTVYQLTVHQAWAPRGCPAPSRHS